LFESNQAIEAFLPGLVNDAHAAVADFFQDFKAELEAGRNWFTFSAALNAIPGI
jgi:hypothetical protein